ncbi:Fc.00g059030.m01.CDS01 [Cosmosporella sp. VM-42]
MSEEPSLPRLPSVSWDEQSQSFSHNPRKRVRPQADAPSPGYNSSDPAIFSSDDDPALDNYVEGRRKKRYIGSWFQQHPTSSDSTFSETLHIPKPKQRRVWTRQADSGVFLGSDGNESEDMMDHPEISTRPKLPQLDRKPIRSVSKVEQAARDKIRVCLEKGEETIDFWSMGLEEISNDTITPLSQFSCIPHVTKDVAFEQKDPELKIYLAMNRLSRVPGAIFDLTYLTILSLRGNKLTELPPAISRLNSLRELNVSQNRLRYLPTDLLDLIGSNNNKLRTLVVHPNPFFQPEHDFEEDGIVGVWGTESHEISSLVSKSLGRSPVQLSNTTGRVLSDFRLPTDPTMRILPVEVDSTDDSELPSPVSSKGSLDDPRSLAKTSGVPSLLEIALRSCYGSTQLPEMIHYIPEGLLNLRQLLDRAVRQKQAGGLTCSSCRKMHVVPTAEWVEWRELRTSERIGDEGYAEGYWHWRLLPLSKAEGEMAVPFLHRGCSWACGPKDTEKSSWGIPGCV